MQRLSLSRSGLSRVRCARRHEHARQTPLRVAVWRRNALGDEKDESPDAAEAASTSQPPQQPQQSQNRLVERLRSTITSGLRSFPLPDLDEDSRAMLSELISPPPPEEEDEEGGGGIGDENEEEDSDDDELVIGARRGAAAAAAGGGSADSDDIDDIDDDIGSRRRSFSRGKKEKEKTPPSLGARGGGWVLAQFAALFFVIFPPTAVTLGVQVLGVLCVLGGAALAAAGVGSIGVRSLSPFPAPRKCNELAEKGAYSLVRHPMYGGLTLFAFGAAASSASPGRAAAAAALYLILEAKIAIEEKAMRKRHGRRYEEYASRTRKMIPFIW